jgi:gliding motility-associated-like protein
LEEPSGFQVHYQSRNLSCQPGQASLELGLTGGSGGYVYQWSTGASTQNLSNVFPNFYALTLSDANGCSISLAGLRVNNCSSSLSFNLSTGASRSVCVDTTDLAGPVATVINLCAGAVNNGILGPIGADGCFSYQAQSAGNDTVCIQVCNAGGTFCDTTTVVFVVSSAIDTFRQVVLANRNTVVCPPLTGLSGSLVSARDLGCAPLNLGLLNGLDQLTGCVDYGAGFRMGFDTLCVEYCDNQGLCDTTVLILQIQSPVDTVRQDVALGGTATACPPLFAFPGNVLTVVDLGCAALSGGSISNFDLTNGCVTFAAGNSPDVDTVCVAICDDQGFCDTAVLIFTVVPRVRSSYLTDTVRLGQVGSNCGVDLSEVPNIQTITNVCAGLGNVRFTLGNAACVEFEGLSLGRDTACIVVCNAQGLCDTTYIIVQVVLAPPVLLDDRFTPPNTTAPFAFAICDNDTFSRIAYTLRILNQPRLGGLQGTDCALSYRLNGVGFCGRDSFQYSVENPSGVDTAWVYFDIPCRPFSITDGISPNGDGINDYFTIYGIQNYPDHEVLIFNRWGALVFQAKNYQNDWMGTFNGRDLPDGQYFYFIYLNNPQAEFYQGSLMILR